MDNVRRFCDRMREDIDALETIELELGALTPAQSDCLDATREVLRETEHSLECIENPAKRRAGQRVASLRLEPDDERDELGIVVLRDPLGGMLALGPTDIGETGAGPNATRSVWDPCEPINFVDRRAFGSLCRSRELTDRIVVLDPKASRTRGFGNLFELIASSPSRVQHPDDIAKNVVRGTTSLALLKQWVAHPDVRRDPSRLRIVHERLMRVEAELAREAAAE